MVPVMGLASSAGSGTHIEIPGEFSPILSTLRVGIRSLKCQARQRINSKG